MIEPMFPLKIYPKRGGPYPGHCTGSATGGRALETNRDCSLDDASDNNPGFADRSTLTGSNQLDFGDRRGFPPLELSQSGCENAESIFIPHQNSGFWESEDRFIEQGVKFFEMERTKLTTGLEISNPVITYLSSGA
jgi:hypothetical protein